MSGTRDSERTEEGRGESETEGDQGGERATILSPNAAADACRARQRRDDADRDDRGTEAGREKRS